MLSSADQCPAKILAPFHNIATSRPFERGQFFVSPGGQLILSPDTPAPAPGFVRGDKIERGLKLGDVRLFRKCSAGYAAYATKA
jgi:hypothetical protein